MSFPQSWSAMPFHLLEQPPSLAHSLTHACTCTYSPDRDLPAPSNSQLPAVVSPLGTHRHTHKACQQALWSCQNGFWGPWALGSVWCTQKSTRRPLEHRKALQGLWGALESPQRPPRAQKCLWRTLAAKEDHQRPLAQVERHSGAPWPQIKAFRELWGTKKI